MVQVIFSGGILGVMGAFSFSTRVVSTSARQSEAVAIAERELQRAILSAPKSMAPVTDRDDRYQWTVQFAERPEGLVLATTVVSWSVRGETQQYRLSRLFLPLSQEE